MYLFSVKTLNKMQFSNPIPYILAIVVPTTVMAQDRHTLVHPGSQVDRTVPIDLGAGQTLYACMVHYAFDDSSHVELMWADPDQQVTNARSYRLSGPMTYLQDAARMNDGLVVCGSSDAVTPFLMKTDDNGDAQWHVGFPALSFGQYALVTVLAGAGGLRAYTSGSIANGSYRITGDGTGAAFNAVSMTASPTAQFTTWGAVASDSGDFVFGHGALGSDPNNRRMLVMKVDSTGAQWMRLFDMDAASWWNEYVRDVEMLADGGTLVAGHASDGGAGSIGYLMKLDGAGVMVWCRKYTDGSDALGLTGAIELNGGDLLVAAHDLDETLILMRLDPMGAILWQEQLPIGFHQPDDLFGNDLGELRLMEHDATHGLDANGIGCGFVANTSVTSAPHTPAITDVAMTNTAMVPTTVPLTHEARTTVLSWDPDCLSTSAQASEAPEWSVHPNPVEGTLLIGASGQVAASEQIVVLDAAGRVVFRGSYRYGIDASALVPGTYSVVLPDRGIRARFIRR